MAARASYGEDRQRGELDFQSLVDLHYGPLYRFAMSLTRAESDACDLVQQTFLTWATKGHQLQDPSKVKSWLYTTLHRAFLESRRRSTRFPHLEITEAEAELPSVEPELVTNDMRQVRQFMARRHAPADYYVPQGLERLQLTGGGRLTWRSNPVTMVCLWSNTRATG